MIFEQDIKEAVELNPFNMLADALRWNMVNVIRVELFFNCYRIWNIFVSSSLQSPRGQYAIVSLVITLLAQLATQFNLSWLLTIYAIYLLIGMVVWIKRRVYFYHRPLNPLEVNETIYNYDLARRTSSSSSGGNGNGNNGNGNNGSGDKGSTGTLGKSDKYNNHHNNYISENTNTLQRQRALAYREFKNRLAEPRHNHKEYAISLAHLSNVAKLVADKDVFDEMHFQMVATRRDVVNMIIRTVLIIIATILAYFN